MYVILGSREKETGSHKLVKSVPWVTQGSHHLDWEKHWNGPE